MFTYHKPASASATVAHAIFDRSFANRGQRRPSAEFSKEVNAAFPQPLYWRSSCRDRVSLLMRSLAVPPGEGGATVHMDVLEEGTASHIR